MKLEDLQEFQEDLNTIYNKWNEYAFTADITHKDFFFLMDRVNSLNSEKQIIRETILDMED